VSRRLDELMRAADPVDTTPQHAITGDHDDPLYLAIRDRREDVKTLEKTKRVAPGVGSRNRRSVAAFAAGFAAALAIGALWLLTPLDIAEPPSPGTSPSVQNPAEPPTTTPETIPTEPGAVVEHLYAVLLDDTDAATALFADDAVIAFQVAPSPGGGTVEGYDAIRTWLAKAKAGMESIELTRVEVDGDTVTFDDTAIQTSCFGGPRCVMDVTGHEVVVNDGKIVRWDFGSFKTRPVETDS